jgi:hypothetical protein
MKHEQNTNRLSEIAYRLANDQGIKIETINDLTAEERAALDALLENGSVETLCAEHETSPIAGMWWLA